MCSFRLSDSVKCLGQWHNKGNNGKHGDIQTSHWDLGTKGGAPGGEHVIYVTSSTEGATREGNTEKKCRLTRERM